MSILFGICQPEGHLVEERDLMELSQGTARFAPDGTFVRAEGRIGMGIQPYHTHLRSRLESQPTVDAHSNMLTFDGRIDNYSELCALLELPKDVIADSEIVLAAFERWGEECFSRIVGDWALALWSRLDRTLYLARDHAGTRTLYFDLRGDSILWSTYLETHFVKDKSRDLNRDFVSCFLASQPIGDLTPHQGISAVTPAHYLAWRDGRFVRNAHWQWVAKDKIRYRSNVEYQEHFLTLFRQSVNRRTGKGAPILAELSGGMDSSSIVCISDHMRKEQGAGPSELLDTVSYYDESDPAWDEAPYFTCVERVRQKPGIHLPLPLLSNELLPAPVPDLLPGAELAAWENEQRFHQKTQSDGFRVTLSGLGGDELLGGVPTALPELADYFAQGHLRLFARRAVPWCMHLRRPLLHVSVATIKFLLDQYSKPRIPQRGLPPWATDNMRRRIQKSVDRSIDGYQSLGLAPSAISNGRTWWATIETLPHLHPGNIQRVEYRYPYLDRIWSIFSCVYRANNSFSRDGDDH